MRFVPVNRLEPSMIVARQYMEVMAGFYLILAWNWSIRILGDLSNLGIPGVYIQDEYIGEIEYHDVVSEKPEPGLLAV